jgi:DNA-binding CsgD family transcriptional regulator/tetratricopeptide (TPR) repeat protein
MHGGSGLSDDPTPADEVLRRTEGNPLYVEELVASGDSYGAIPPTLAQLILARVNRLPQPTPAVLLQAAVLGELVDDEWLAELTGRPLAVVVEALRAAVAHHLLVVDRVGFRFRHALVREALYEDLLPGERERLHASAVRLIQGQQRRIPEHVRQTLLAYHAYAAGDFETAFAASVQAGLECERVFALSAAAVQYERALSLWDRVADPDAAAGTTQSDLYIRAAEAVFFGSRSDRAVGLMEAALTALPSDGVPEQRVELLDRIVHIDVLLKRGQASLDACQRAVALVADRPASPEKALALVTLGRTLMLRSQYREAEPLLRQAIAIADRVEARAVAGRALGFLAVVLVGFGRGDEGVTAHRQALQASRDYGTAVDVCVSYLNMSHDLVVCGRYDEADQVAREGVAYADDTGQAFYSVAISGNRLFALFCAGRWREAEQVWNQVRDRVPEATTWLHGYWFEVLLARGQVREAREIIETLLEVTADAAEVQSTAETLLHAGRLADLEQRWDDSREFFRRGIELARASDDQHFTSRGYASAIRVERRRVESVAGSRGAIEGVRKARQIADQLIQQASDLPARLSANGIQLMPGPAAWLQTVEAEHAAICGEDTAQMWADLSKTWEGVGQPFRQADAQCREADALLRERGDRDRAVEPVTAALKVAERLGAAPLAADIRRLAQRARLDLTSTPGRPPNLPPSPAATPFGLTDRELAVLKLLGQGKTNSEIGAALFISRKTASVHVTNILRKLDVSTRVQAAAVAERTGMLDAG